jgi:hypothetical protein
VGTIYLVAGVCMQPRGNLHPFIDDNLRTGSHTECLYALLKAKLPLSMLPLTLEGELQIDAHTRWLQSRVVERTEGGR